MQRLIGRQNKRRLLYRPLNISPDMNNWKTPNMFGAYSDSNVLPRMRNLESRLWREENMTFILGASCSDGIVLVGDTKITIRTGFNYSYSNKIDMPLNTNKVNMPLNTVAMCSAGFSGVYNEFKDRLLDRISAIESEQQNITEEKYRILVCDIIKEIANGYGQDRNLVMRDFYVLSANRINGLLAHLAAFSSYGFYDLTDKYKVVGSGELYGDIFIRGIWTPEWTMEQTAKLGIFIIKFVRDLKLDYGIGFSDEVLPQVFYFPRIQTNPIKELSQEEVRKLISEADFTISDFRAFLNEKFKV